MHYLFHVHVIIFYLCLLELDWLMATAATARLAVPSAITALVTTRATAFEGNVVNRVHFDDDNYTFYKEKKLY